MLHYWVAILWIAADQITKFFILQKMVVGESIPVFPQIFHITFVHNTGIAFGLLRDHPFWLTGFIFLCILILLFYSLKLSKISSFERIAYGLILGGAIGNFIDRMRFGAVVDFLDFQIWPVFNLADSGITIGVTLFAWKILFGQKTSRENS